jgi:FkbM family methyltransferase|tara:strand:+ start:1048 stop:1818 length:771 start_codon:yes stop_codon:yes gene_type:complete
VFLGDYVSTQVILHGVYEKGNIEALKQNVFPKLPSKSVCLDVGANIGNHAVAFSKTFGKVVAFEPNPIVFLLLQANSIGRNIKPINSGLSSKSGKLLFEQDFDNLGASKIINLASASSIEILVTTLDDEIPENEIQSVSFIKIDVEGHEYEVLRGAKKLLESAKPVLAIEAIYRSETEAGEKVEKLLRSVGYTYFYKMSSNSKLVKFLEKRQVDLNRSYLRFLVSQKQIDDQSIVEIETLAGTDNPLAIVSTFDLL